LQKPTPSLAVIRNIMGANCPAILETLDALKTKFAARLVALEIPEAGLSLGDRARYDAMQPWQHEEKRGTKDWKPKAPQGKPPRRPARRAARF
jgi:hypothetical protein